MFESKHTAVVIPARNEALLLPRVLAKLPAWVDRIIVVDDASQDATAEITAAHAQADPRLTLVRHRRRRGVGGAIASGYARALRDGADLVVVMAGDDQMDPRDLPQLLLPAARGEADYVKGDRFARAGQTRHIPTLRRWGNRALSAATRWITGAPTLSDAQCGYTVITRPALTRLRPERIYPGYGYPNDVLARLAGMGARVAQVPVRARYGVGERSKMRIPLVLLPLALLLTRLLVLRAAARLRRTPASTHRYGVQMLPPSADATPARQTP